MRYNSPCSPGREYSTYLDMPRTCGNLLITEIIMMPSRFNLRKSKSAWFALVAVLGSAWYLMPGSTSVSQEKLPPGAKVVKIEAQPRQDRAEARLRLSPAAAHRRPRQRRPHRSHPPGGVRLPRKGRQGLRTRPGAARRRRQRRVEVHRGRARAARFPSRWPAPRTSTRSASSATSCRPCRAWAATPAPATAAPRARTASSSRCAATIRSSITAP